MDTEKKIFAIVAAVLVFLTIIVGLTNSATAPERDGFNVLEKHESYMIVEKDGQKYMASDVGVFTHKWTYTPID